MINGAIVIFGDKFGSFVSTLITTTSQVVFSVTFARTLSEIHGGRVDPTYGYMGPCEGFIPPFFAFPYTLDSKPKAYTWMDYSYFYTKPIPNDNTTSYAGFSDMNMTKTSYWVLGSPFFASLYDDNGLIGLYTIFDRDNDRIGFVRGRVKT
ncbi:hypothetical protein C2G38_5316 [Gigaspora rosea]|uniref:Aspartic peptidase domain-containing protein n=1 Tax=Gigaspora rosea TaxID=44941 RepID=A0A397W7A3_9GLOM|nr:hypothetical protein C2G38_5316 [Gigaspora rosea]